MMKVLVTGVAGFIGSAFAHLLLKQGYQVIGIDNLNDYYDVSLKKSRLNLLQESSQFTFHFMDLLEEMSLATLFEKEKFDYVVNLAAQAGVRHSFEQPRSYINSNIIGFFNILECCRHFPVKHLVYASSSSVYGGTKEKPSSESLKIDKPLSLYAASKKSNELMAYSYANLFDLPSTGLRFFSVYGPWGRPDMALFKFVKNILEDKPIVLFNHGNMTRDFTYIDDIINGIFKVMQKPPLITSSDENVRAKIYNIGRGKPVKLLEFVLAIENETGKKAIVEEWPMQPGDVETSHSDITTLKEEIGYTPIVEVQEGIKQFVAWYKQYYEIAK